MCCLGRQTDEGVWSKMSSKQTDCNCEFPDCAKSSDLPSISTLLPAYNCELAVTHILIYVDCHVRIVVRVSCINLLKETTCIAYKWDGVILLVANCRLLLCWCYQAVCDYLTVGPYTRCIPSRPSLPRGASERHVLAVPLESSIHTAVQWFLFANDFDLQSVFTYYN